MISSKPHTICVGENTNFTVVRKECIRKGSEESSIVKGKYKLRQLMRIEPEHNGLLAIFVAFEESKSMFYKSSKMREKKVREEEMK